MTSTLFTITDATHRRWQHRNLLALTDLVKLGEKHQLPPLLWTLPGIGSVSGKVDSRDMSEREGFEAWHAALMKYPKLQPQGRFNQRDQPHRSERTDGMGQTRLLAVFSYTLPGHPAVDVCLLAEWFKSWYRCDD